MDSGFITLHRKFLDWEWYDDIKTKTLFIHCLIKANYKEKSWRGQTIERGSFLTSYQTLADETGLSVRSIRTSIGKLESTGELTRKSTSKLTRIIITKYSDYQDVRTIANGLATSQTTSNATNERQGSDKPTTTTNKDNHITKKPVKRFVPPTKQEVFDYCQERKNKVDANKFFNHYESNGWLVGKNKMKKWRAAIVTWEGNDFNSAKPNRGLSNSTPSKIDPDEEF